MAPDLNIPELKPGIKALRVLIGCFLLISISTQGILDPTPLNPVWPTQGFENWMHLPGALIGGFLLDFFGLSALILAVYFLVFRFHHFKSLLLRITAPILTLFLINMFFSLILNLFGMEDTTFTGGWGYAATEQIAGFPGFWVSIFIVTASLIYLFSYLRPDTWLVGFIIAVGGLAVYSLKENMPRIKGFHFTVPKLKFLNRTPKESEEKPRTVTSVQTQPEKADLFQNALAAFEKENHQSSETIQEAETVESIFDDLLEGKDQNK